MKRPCWASFACASALACASACLVADAASATTTRLFRQTTAKDFDNPTDAKDSLAAGAQPAKGTRIVTGPAPASGTIYRLDDDGRIEQLFALPDGYLTSLLLDEKGNLLASASGQGKIYRIAPDRTVALAADISERQALSMVHSTSVTCRAHDAGSVISAIEFCVEVGEWRPAQPDDGLLDERDEAFTLQLPKALTPGPHLINVRA
jgi:hypothetical protein